MLRSLIFALACLVCTAAVAQTAAKEFAIILRLAPHYQADSVWTDADKAAVGEHFTALQKLQQAGKLVFAGRTTNVASMGIIVLKNMSEAEARAVLAADKAVQRGIMQAEFQPFQTALKERE